jgi:signal transduction histidine kinase
MGEAIGNIAHQWRQPLNSVGIIIQDVQECYEYGELTPDYLENRVRQAMELIDHMSRTINEFCSLYRPENAMEPFSVGEAVSKAVKFLAGSNDVYGVRLELFMEEDVIVTGLPGEYSQVVLTILDYAREALVERRVANACIKIHVSECEAKSLVTIADNAGGVPEELMGNIFDPYSSASGAGRAGLGLCMSKSIIEQRMKGRLTARNGDEGAVFMIEV